jgi:DNA-binding NarL/FixJ family response regulator
MGLAGRQLGAMGVMWQVKGLSGMKLVVVSEHPCCRIGMATILAGVDQAATILEAKNIDELIDVKNANGPIDLVLMEGASQIGREMASMTRLQETDGIGAVILLHEQNQPEIVRRYLDMGIQGVVPKTTDAAVLVGAVRLVLSGGRYVPESILAKESKGFGESNYAFNAVGLDRLTRRQMDVLKELGRGASNQEIGTQLGIALATVKLHVNAILNTLGVRNRTEAAIIAYRAGLTDLSAQA